MEYNDTEGDKKDPYYSCKRWGGGGSYDITLETEDGLGAVPDRGLKITIS